MKRQLKKALGVVGLTAAMALLTGCVPTDIQGTCNLIATIQEMNGPTAATQGPKPDEIRQIGKVFGALGSLAPTRVGARRSNANLVGGLHRVVKATQALQNARKIVVVSCPRCNTRNAGRRSSAVRCRKCGSTFGIH